MEANNKKQNKENNMEKEVIKSRPNKLLVILVISVVILSLLVGGIYLYTRFTAKPVEIDDGSIQYLRYIEVTADKAMNLIDSNEELIVVDVSNDFVNGHIPGAINIPIDDLADNLDEFDLEDTILVYGRFNMNSVDAANLFADKGFNNLYRLKGEYDAWLSEGYNIETGEGSGTKKDSDKDGISDKEENALGTDPKNPDTDNDGLLDGEEIKLGTDITNPDSDQDGFLDGEEVEKGYDPNAKPDQSQNKTMEQEEINLVAINISGAEGTADRYMSKGKYYLEVSSILPKLAEDKKYIAFLIDDVNNDTVRIGELKYTKDYQSDENMEYAYYDLEYETDHDYSGYYVVEVGIQEEKDLEKILTGEFERN